MTGRVVCSKAGRDKGYFMVVLGTDGGCLLVSDGKERPIERPKRKNAKHVVFTNTTLDESSFRTNKSLKKALAVFRGTGDEKEEI